MIGDINSLDEIPSLVSSINKKMAEALKVMNLRAKPKDVILKFTQQEMTLITNHSSLNSYTEGLSTFLSKVKVYDENGLVTKENIVDKDSYLNNSDVDVYGHYLIPGKSNKDKHEYIDKHDDTTIFTIQDNWVFDYPDHMEKDFSHYPLLFDENKMAKHKGVPIIDYAYNVPEALKRGLNPRGYRKLNDSYSNYKERYEQKLVNFNLTDHELSEGRNGRNKTESIYVYQRNKVYNYGGRWDHSSANFCYMPKNENYIVFHPGGDFRRYKSKHANNEFYVNNVSKTNYLIHSEYRSIRLKIKFTDKNYFIPGVVDAVRSMVSCELTNEPDKDYFTVRKELRSFYAYAYENLPKSGRSGWFPKHKHFLSFFQYNPGSSMNPYTLWVINDRTFKIPEAKPGYRVKKIKPKAGNNTPGMFQSWMNKITDNDRNGHYVFLHMRVRLQFIIFGEYLYDGLSNREVSDEQKSKWINAQWMWDHIMDREKDKIDYVQVLCDDFSIQGKAFATKMIKTLVRKNTTAFHIHDYGWTTYLTKAKLPSLKESLELNYINVTMLLAFLALRDPEYSDSHFFFLKKKTDGMEEDELIRMDQFREQKSTCVVRKYRRDAFEVIKMTEMNRFIILNQMMSKLYDARKLLGDLGYDNFSNCLPIRRIHNSINYTTKVGAKLVHDPKDNGLEEFNITFREFDNISAHIRGVHKDVKDPLNPKTIVLATIQDKLKLPDEIRQQLDTKLGELESEKDPAVESDDLKNRLLFLQTPSAENVSELNIEQKCSILLVLQDIEANVNSNEDMGDSEKQNVLNNINSNYYTLLKQSLELEEDIDMKDDDTIIASKEALEKSAYMNGVIRLFKTKRNNQASAIFLGQYSTIKKNLHEVNVIKEDINDSLNGIRSLELNKTDAKYSEIDEDVADEYMKNKIIKQKAAKVKSGLFASASIGLGFSALVNALMKKNRAKKGRK